MIGNISNQASMVRKAPLSKWAASCVLAALLAFGVVLAATMANPDEAQAAPYTPNRISYNAQKDAQGRYYIQHGDRTVYISGISDQTYTGCAMPLNASDAPRVTYSYTSGKRTYSSKPSVSCSNDVNVGEATATLRLSDSNYPRLAYVKYNIVARDVNDAYVKVSPIPDQYYTGKAVKPGITVALGPVVKGRTTYPVKPMVAGKDYDVKYSNNTKPGTARVTITGKGNFKGTKTVTFKIKSGRPDISKATIDGVVDKTYTGSPITQAITVKHDNKTLKPGTDYDVTYANNTQMGTATMTVVGKGVYAGTSANRTFKIGKGVLQISYKASNNVQYHQITRTGWSQADMAKQDRVFGKCLWFNVVNAKGRTITYSKGAGSDQYLDITPDGSVTMKKGATKGTHTMNVVVTAAENDQYQASTVTVPCSWTIK